MDDEIGCSQNDLSKSHAKMNRCQLFPEASCWKVADLAGQN